MKSTAEIIIIYYIYIQTFRVYNILGLWSNFIAYDANSIVSDPVLARRPLTRSITLCNCQEYHEESMSKPFWLMIDQSICWLVLAYIIWTANGVIVTRQEEG